MSKKVEKEINDLKEKQGELETSSSTKPKESKKKEKKSEPTSEKNQEVIQLEGNITNLKKEIETFKEKYLRSLADLDNLKKDYKKEIEREKLMMSKLIKYSNEELIKQLLFFPDNYERALQFSQNNPDPKIQNFLTGFQMVLTKFQNLLKKEGVEEIKITPQKDTYDSKSHEDLLEVREIEENNNYPDGTILQVLRKGYKIHERVLRPAQVKISKAKEIENQKK